MGRGFKKTTVVFRKDAKGNTVRHEFATDEYNKQIPKKIPYANGLASLSVGAATKREAKLFNERIAANGIKGVHFDPHTCDAVFESRKARADFGRNAESVIGRKVVDLDGGYGDYTGD